MVERFDRDVVRHRPAWVLLLGGSNDLGWNLQPAEIIRNLTAMYERAGGAPRRGRSVRPSLPSALRRPRLFGLARDPPAVPPGSGRRASPGSRQIQRSETGTLRLGYRRSK